MAVAADRHTIVQRYVENFQPVAPAKLIATKSDK